MRYPKWAPKLFLLASLSLGSCNLQEKADNIKHRIEKVFMTEYQPEYIKNGRNRLLRVKGRNLDKLHTITEREFIKEIEKEIKNPQNSYIMSNFQTSVVKVGNEYIFEYSLDLNPAKNLRPQRVVDMRGTVWSGKNAKNIVLDINRKKIPDWQRKMKQHYQGVHFSLARSDKPNLYHEAVLAKAEK